MAPEEKRCIFCDGPLGDALFADIRDRLGLLEGTWNFLRCRDCGSAVLDPMPSPEELLAAYPEAYAMDQAPQTHWVHRFLYQLETKFFYEPLYRASVQQVIRNTGLREGRLLDVGGGTGKRTVFFQRAGFEAWVLEPDERPLKVAREKFNLGTLWGTIEEIDGPPESWDLITFYAVIEHLPSPQRAIQAATRLLRPGGWVVAMVPVLDSWQARILGACWFQVQEVPRHVSLPTRAGMRALFTRNGLLPQTWEGEPLLNRAGIIALSLVSSAKSDVACATTEISSRLIRRAAGALTMIACLPLAVLEGMAGSPGAAVFFARKPA
jgi:SAM-dependent methyltransferase